MTTQDSKTSGSETGPFNAGKKNIFNRLTGRKVFNRLILFSVVLLVLAGAWLALVTAFPILLFESLPLILLSMTWAAAGVLGLAVLQRVVKLVGTLFLSAPTKTPDSPDRPYDASGEKKKESEENNTDNKRDTPHDTKIAIGNDTNGSGLAERTGNLPEKNADKDKVKDDAHTEAESSTQSPPVGNSSMPSGDPQKEEEENTKEAGKLNESGASGSVLNNGDTGGKKEFAQNASHQEEKNPTIGYSAVIKEDVQKGGSASDSGQNGMDETNKTVDENKKQSEMPTTTPQEHPHVKEDSHDQAPPTKNPEEEKKDDFSKNKGIPEEKMPEGDLPVFTHKGDSKKRRSCSDISGKEGYSEDLKELKKLVDRKNLLLLEGNELQEWELDVYAVLIRLKRVSEPLNWIGASFQKNNYVLNISGACLKYFSEPIDNSAHPTLKGDSIMARKKMREEVNTHLEKQDAKNKIPAKRNSLPSSSVFGHSMLAQKTNPSEERHSVLFAKSRGSIDTQVRP